MFVAVLQMLTGHVLPKLTNMSHVINKVAFGPEFPGQVNPLDGFNRITKDGDILRAYKYFLKVRGAFCMWSWAPARHPLLARRSRMYCLGCRPAGCGRRQDADIPEAGRQARPDLRALHVVFLIVCPAGGMNAFSAHTHTHVANYD